MNIGNKLNMCSTIIYIASYEKWRRFIKSKTKGEKQTAYKCAFLLFWISRVATNIARKYIHVTIFQVGIINICFLDIIKTVKVQKLENIYQ